MSAVKWLGQPDRMPGKGVVLELLKLWACLDSQTARSSRTQKIFQHGTNYKHTYTDNTRNHDYTVSKQDLLSPRTVWCS